MVRDHLYEAAIQLADIVSYCGIEQKIAFSSSTSNVEINWLEFADGCESVGGITVVCECIIGFSPSSLSEYCLAAINS